MTRSFAERAAAFGFTRALGESETDFQRRVLHGLSYVPGLTVPALMSPALNASRWIRYVSINDAAGELPVLVDVRTWRMWRIPTRWLRRRVKRQVFEAVQPGLPVTVALKVTV